MIRPDDEPFIGESDLEEADLEENADADSDSDEPLVNRGWWCGRDQDCL